LKKMRRGAQSVRRKPMATLMHMRQVAVIDIGSNSVRLVIYDMYGAHFTPVYNEKLHAGLGRDLKRTGCLSKTGKVETLEALDRFRTILVARGLDNILIGATAALREAKDAPEFLAEVKQKTGFDIQPISGEEEARLSALGVIAGDARRRGLSADLGGASLEFTVVADGEVGTGVSLPLGPFDAIGGQLSDLQTKDYRDVRPKLKSALATLPADMDIPDTLFLIGGAWRNLAAIHQARLRYPMRTLQAYRLSFDEARFMADWAWRDGRETVLNWPGLRAARAETLPYAGLMLGVMLEHFQPKAVEICIVGLRDGLVYDALPEDIRKRDALLDGCRDFARGNLQSAHFGRPLLDLLAPVMESLPDIFDPETDHRLLRAACILAGLGKNLHPDYRPELVFEDVLYAPVSGLSHVERAFLSLALFRTYTAKRKPPNPDIVKTLLTESQIESAALVGEGIRLAIIASGRSPELLDAFHLAITDKTLVFRVREHQAALLTSSVVFRLEKLASRMGLASRTETYSASS